MRNLACLLKGRPSKVGEDSLWQVHVEGAMGEAACAKALGTYNPMTVNTFKGPDIGKKIQVRTRSRACYDLIVRANDDDDEAFILVTGTCPKYTVRGWCWGREAKQARHLKNHGGHGEAWFVPAEHLRPIAELPKDVF